MPRSAQVVHPEWIAAPVETVRPRLRVELLQRRLTSAGYASAMATSVGA